MNLDFVKEHYSEKIIEFVKFHLRKTLHRGCGELVELPEIFNKHFYVYVSLNSGNYVRGVDGTFDNPEPLAKALTRYSFGAAVSDDRFAPVRIGELNHLKIFVTLVDKNDIMNSVVIES